MEFNLGKAPMEGELGDFPGPVRLMMVDETKLERLWDDLVRQYHYLGYDSVIGSRVKYLIAFGERIVGAISFCSAAYQLGMRDKFIGWDDATRRALLPHLVNNNRFLILPWIKVRNLASHVLSMSLNQLSKDWEDRYGVEPYMAETFVDSERFSGSCYAAANWIRLGSTRGFGRQGKEFVYHGQTKDLFVKVMSRSFAKSFRPDAGRLREVEGDALAEAVRAFPVSCRKTLGAFGLPPLSPESLAGELAAHLKRYVPYLNRKELIGHFAAMVKGLLSDLESKAIEPISAAFQEPGQYRYLTSFMTRGR